ncbi:MAG: hypothetical protein N3H31_01785 [Candidatus Nezhaarchaeota archaeon]|nr:hypothetical protein [Candidatus Nezhaarchaeota archaeon]
MLEGEDVRRRFDNLAAKSYLNAIVYLRNLGLYCELNKTDPKALLKVAKTKAFRDGLLIFCLKARKRGQGGPYIARLKKTLHSRLSYNGLDVRLKVNVRGERETSTIANEGPQAENSLTGSL